MRTSLMRHFSSKLLDGLQKTCHNNLTLNFSTLPVTYKIRKTKSLSKCSLYWCQNELYNHKLVHSVHSENSSEEVQEPKLSDSFYVNGTNITEDEWLSSATDRKIGVTLGEQRKLLKKKPHQPLNPRLLKVAIIGAPNAGKSTLANQLLGWRYSAVSSKVHTTRHKSIGVLTEGDTQIIFLDTPGMINAQKRRLHKLERTLLTDPHSTLYDADVIIVVVDISEVWHRSQLNLEIRKALELHRDKHVILVQNKTDLYSRKEDLLHTAKKLTEGYIDGSSNWFTVKQKNKKVKLTELFDRVDGKLDRETSYIENISEDTYNNTGTESCDKVNLVNENEDDKDLEEEWGNFTLNAELKPDLNDNKEWQKYYNDYLKKIERKVEKKSGFDGFARVFHISAINHSGVSELKDYLLGRAQPGPWEYNEAVITDLNPIDIAKMCVWEKLLDHLPKEVPYSVEIKLSLWEVDDDGMLRASFDLICTKKRHLAKLLAGGGSLMKTISMEAKQELMNTFRCEMSLYLVVKASPALKK